MAGRCARARFSKLVRTEKPSHSQGGAMTKAQEVYERVEALVATGVRKADAFRQVADELGQPFNSMRGAYYAHTRTLGGTPARSRTRQAANGDPIEQATLVLSKALESIDAE